MSIAELDQVVGAMRATMIDMSAEPSRLRKHVDDMLSALPVPKDLSVETSTLAGMDVLLSKNAKAVEGRALLYLHGGGYTFGSPRSYLALAGNLGAPLTRRPIYLLPTSTRASAACRGR